MKCAALAAAALIASSFTPIALPTLVGTAAATPTPDVALCTDNSLLGPAQNGHFWGHPYILPIRNVVTGTLGEPIPMLGGGEAYSGMMAVSLQAVIQRCPVMNAAGHPTGEYQDVELTAAHHTTFQLNCTHTGASTVPPPYLDCEIAHLTGSSGDDR